jgi:hypothetical protein
MKCIDILTSVIDSENKAKEVIKGGDIQKEITEVLQGSKELKNVTVTQETINDTVSEPTQTTQTEEEN